MTMKLLDKIALITGGGSGIGRASAILFAQEGAAVVVACRNESNGQSAVDQITQNGGKAIFVKADVSKAEDAERMVKTTIETYGRIDILFNNAGIAPLPIPTEELEEEQWDRTMAVNVKGIFLGCKYAIPFLKTQKSGIIINTASASGVRPRQGTSAYCASKGAAIILTKALALELASFGIRVNCINPVATNTPMAEWLATSGQNKNVIATIPLGRFAQPEEIAHAALYLASDESLMVTGVALDVDGGRSI
jgi:3-oxoacyl-[acyl-carrier protein] reductase